MIINEFYRPTIVELTVSHFREAILDRLTAITSRETVAVAFKFQPKSTEMVAYMLDKWLDETAVLVKAARLNEYQQYGDYCLAMKGS